MAEAVTCEAGGLCHAAGGSVPPVVCYEMPVTLLIDHDTRAKYDERHSMLVDALVFGAAYTLRKTQGRQSGNEETCLLLRVRRREL